jgi:carboxymethylenebutenolidase
VKTPSNSNKYAVSIYFFKINLRGEEMKKRILFFAFMLSSALLTVHVKGRAETEGLPEGKTVSYRSDGEEVSGFLVVPEGKGPFPAIVVIHEWWGLNEQVKRKARELAKEGYVTLAVDLYRGKVTDDPEEAHELLRGLPEDRAIRDLLSAVSYLKTLPNVKKDKIGSIGWCMGGGFSLSLAVNSPELAACVVYYGRLITDREQLKRIKAPILGFFGEEDRGIPVSSVRAFEKTMKELGKEVTVYIYPNAGHAFANEERPSYNPEAAKDAWAKTLSFFEKTLKRAE